MEVAGVNCMLCSMGVNVGDVNLLSAVCCLLLWLVDRLLLPALDRSLLPLMALSPLFFFRTTTEFALDFNAFCSLGTAGMGGTAGTSDAFRLLVRGGGGE